MSSLPLIPFSDLARKAAAAANCSLKFPRLAREDWEDMAQEAEIALWRLRDRSEGYAFVAAKGEARTHFWRYVVELRRKDGVPAGVRLPQDNKVQIPESEQGDILLEHIDQGRDEPIPTTKLTGEIIDAIKPRLVELVGCAPEGKRLQSHLDVLELLCAGQHSNDAIAREMGLAPRTVHTYRSALRRVLREMLRECVLGQIESQQQ